jgi:hypothetical protein
MLLGIRYASHYSFALSVFFFSYVQDLFLTFSLDQWMAGLPSWRMEHRYLRDKLHSSYTLPYTLRWIAALLQAVTRQA